MFLLDTNVLSAARRPDRHEKLAALLDTQPEASLFISVITIGEIARGIRQQERRNPEFANNLRVWLNRTEAVYQDRILPFTSQDARIWGELSAEIGHPGADLMIAATAIVHKAMVVTNNVSDFAPTGVEVVDPF